MRVRPEGEPVVGPVPHGHYKSLTPTAALRADGPTAAQVLDGPMTGERFRHYVTAVLVPTLRPGDTVVMDDLPRHRAAAVRTAIEAAGCRLLYLPPYSPDLNPIELASARLKRALRADGHREVPKLMDVPPVGRGDLPAGRMPGVHPPLRLRHTRYAATELTLVNATKSASRSCRVGR